MEDEETIVQPGQDEGQPAAENKIDDWASAFEALAPRREAPPRTPALPHKTSTPEGDAQ